MSADDLFDINSAHTKGCLMGGQFAPKLLVVRGPRASQYDATPCMDGLRGSGFAEQCALGCAEEQHSALASTNSDSRAVANCDAHLAAALTRCEDTAS